MSAPELDISQLEELKALLRLKQTELEAQLDSIEAGTRPVTLDQQSVGRVSRIDAIQQQQMAIANQQQIEQQSRLVNAALERLELGDYGDCLNCGETIAFARLQAQPFASLCIACQSDLEKR